jgi:hypothetical protein
MRKGKEFNNILDECLERLLVGGKTIEQCLQNYPEQAAELKPLLETALVVKKASAIQPPIEFKARARYQFRSALQEAAPRRSRPFFGWLPRWATALTIVLVVLLVGGGTIVATAAGSMPDDFLYPVKLATEQVQLVLTPSQIGKAELCAEFADRRVEEIVYMAGKGDAHQVELITERLNKHLEMLADLASALEGEEAAMLMAPEEAGADRGLSPPADNRAKLREKVAGSAADNQVALQETLEEVPESVKAALLQAIEIAEAGYEKVLEALD